MTNPFAKFFAPPEEPDTSMIDANDILDWASRPYHAKFMDYLERVADEPLRIGRESSMIESASRANAFKEVRLHIRKQITAAQSIIQEAQGG